MNTNINIIRLGLRAVKRDIDQIIETPSDLQGRTALAVQDSSIRARNQLLQQLMTLHGIPGKPEEL